MTDKQDENCMLYRRRFCNCCSVDKEQGVNELNRYVSIIIIISFQHESLVVVGTYNFISGRYLMLIYEPIS